MAKPSKTAKTLSYRERASLQLAQLRRVAAIHREAGEVLDGPWLKVLANLLSSAPSGPTSKRRGRHAPEWFGLTYETLLVAAERCGLEATAEEIEAQVLDTQAWRHRESERIGRPHYAAMRPDKIGELLGITEIVRCEAKAWNLGTYHGSPKERRAADKERRKIRERERRCEAGSMPRKEYEGASLSRLKPWEGQGISRRTWERRRVETALDNEPRVAKPALSQVRVPQVRARQIRTDDASPCPTIIPSGLRPREFPNHQDNCDPTALGPPMEQLPDCALSPEDAGADRPAAETDMEAAIARWRRIKCEPAPAYQMQPGGIAARALALVKRPMSRAEANKAKIIRFPQSPSTAPDAA